MVNHSSDNVRVSPLLEYGITKAVLQSLTNIKQLNKAATVCKSWNETAKIIKKNRHQIYSTSNLDSYEDSTCIDNLVSVMRSQPCLCVVLLAHDGSPEIPLPIPELSLVGHPGNHMGRCTEYRLLYHLRQKMPQNCVVVGGIANGVVSSTPTLETNEVEQGDAYGLLFIPEIPNMSVRNFYLDRKKMKKIGNVNSSNDSNKVKKKTCW